jgi:hypothetical protein
MAFVAYELFPPAEMTQEKFVRFVQEEVFPSVVMGRHEGPVNSVRRHQRAG